MSAESVRPPREWRITTLDNNDDGRAVLVEGPNADCVHVIEYSAYAILAAENERLKEEFKEAVRSIIGHFFFVDPNTDEPYYDSMCMSDGEEYLPIAIEMGLIDKKQVRQI